MLFCSSLPKKFIVSLYGDNNFTIFHHFSQQTFIHPPSNARYPTKYSPSSTCTDDIRSIASRFLQGIVSLCQIVWKYSRQVNLLEILQRIGLSVHRLYVFVLLLLCVLVCFVNYFVCYIKFLDSNVIIEEYAHEL